MKKLIRRSTLLLSVAQYVGLKMYIALHPLLCIALNKERKFSSFKSRRNNQVVCFALKSPPIMNLSPNRLSGFNILSGSAV